MTRSRPATLDSRLVETGGYGAAMVLLPATLVGVGFLGSGPIADAIGLAIATATLIVVLAAATAQGRAPLVVAATTGGVAVLAIAVVFGVIDRGTSLPFLVQAEEGRFADLLYFSFSTLTTTGFGDLTVADPGRRMLSLLEAVVGQLYLVVLVGALIGSWRLLPSRNDGPARPTEDEPGPPADP